MTCGVERLTVWRSLLKKMRVVNADRMKNGTRHEYANSLPSMSPEGGGEDTLYTVLTSGDTSCHS